jgi:hypothetical protein
MTTSIIIQENKPVNALFNSSSMTKNNKFRCIFVHLLDKQITMKKTIAIFLITFCGFFSAIAQENTLGIRLTSGAEISYQRLLNEKNRLELNFGWGWNTTALTGFYQWVNPLTEGLKWYIGPGASLGFYNNNGKNGTNIGIGGTIGIEYNFDIPLQLSLDWRPMLNFGGSYDSNYGSTNIGLGIRYRF